MSEAKKAEAKKYKITIAPGAEGEDNGDVFIGVNGRTILIKRGHSVVVEECFLEALKNSVIDTFEKDEKGKVTPIKIPRFNFSSEQA
jgi:hypothetical protein